MYINPGSRLYIYAPKLKWYPNCNINQALLVWRSNMFYYTQLRRLFLLGNSTKKSCWGGHLRGNPKDICRKDMIIESKNKQSRMSFEKLNCKISVQKKNHVGSAPPRQCWIFNKSYVEICWHLLGNLWGSEKRGFTRDKRNILQQPKTNVTLSRRVKNLRNTTPLPRVVFSLI